MADLFSATYNPDVLSCLANLSNDEVFTPPELANQVLDLLPEELWSDPNTTFLDPCCKSGVFLREIAKRLIKGLENEIPDLQERLDHIFHKQLFGIAITEITSLLSRRSLYCSKFPNGKYSVSEFDTYEGNVRFREQQHTWMNGRCIYCGASEKELGEDREGLETHAYEFIHVENPEELFDMKFDVIVGNPPYQLSDGGNNASAVPIYQHFVRQAKRLKPRYLVMITPSRWFTGGRNLETFRKEMLTDRHLRVIVDYENASEVFPGVDMSGGVSFFLWDRDNEGPCRITNMSAEEVITEERNLDEYDVLIRSNRAVSILNKVFSATDEFMSSAVSSQRPFGLRTYVKPEKSGELILRWRGGRGPIARKTVTTGSDLIDAWNVIVSRVVYEHAGSRDSQGKRRVLSVLEILAPGEVCTETYIVAASFHTEKEALNCQKYLSLKFPRFLMAQVASAQMINKNSFMFVPMQDFSQELTDADLYSKYALTADEVAYIEATIKPMDLDDSDA